MHFIDESRCTGCGSCLDVCSREAISINSGFAVIDASNCDDCGSCFSACPQGAVYQEEIALTATTPRQPSQVTVSPLVPVNKTSRWVAALAALAPAALDLATELVRSLPYNRGSRAVSDRGGSYRSQTAKSYNRRRWRGGRN
jgi:Fe-S-cluster-containing hydrogenase component 2